VCACGTDAPRPAIAGLCHDLTAAKALPGTNLKIRYSSEIPTSMPQQ